MRKITDSKFINTNKIDFEIYRGRVLLYTYALAMKKNVVTTSVILQNVADFWVEFAVINAGI